MNGLTFSVAYTLKMCKIKEICWKTANRGNIHGKRREGRPAEKIEEFLGILCLFLAQLSFFMAGFECGLDFYDPSVLVCGIW